MLNMDFVLLNFVLLICLVQWRLAQAQSGICLSSGFCKETDKVCKRDTIYSCFSGSGAVPRKRVTYDDGEEVQTYCISNKCSANDTSVTILQNLTVNYLSINPNYLKLIVSWSVVSSGFGGGYELRVINILDQTHLCYCIGNSNRTRVTIHNIRYNDFKMYKSIDVLPYPQPHSSENEIKVSQPLQQKGGCADVQHNGTLCGSKPYPKPENLRVESSRCRNDTKTLNITWDPPSVGSDVLLPEIYYVSLYSIPFNNIYTQRFTVHNASQIELFNLSPALNYEVYVTPYRKCSGLGSATGKKLGCGDPAGQLEKKVDHCDSSTTNHITTWYRSESTVVEQLNATRDDMNLLVPVLTSAIVTLTVLVFAVLLVIFLCTKLNKHLTGEIHSSKPSTMMVNYIYKVFVFYSPSVSQTHKDYIQKYVICNLLKHFKVVTSDDINRGNISIWLEKAVKSADSVLLVANKELCSEWEKEEPSPIMNSLKFLISAAAASKNNIAKFGFISIRESRMDVPIPDNFYLKLMPVFFMGGTNCEVKKVYRFVTRSRGIEFAQNSDHDCVKV